MGFTYQRIRMQISALTAQTFYRERVVFLLYEILRDKNLKYNLYSCYGLVQIMTQKVTALWKTKVFFSNHCSPYAKQIHINVYNNDLSWIFTSGIMGFLGHEGWVGSCFQTKDTLYFCMSLNKMKYLSTHLYLGCPTHLYLGCYSHLKSCQQYEYSRYAN